MVTNSYDRSAYELEITRKLNKLHAYDLKQFREIIILIAGNKKNSQQISKILLQAKRDINDILISNINPTLEESNPSIAEMAKLNGWKVKE